MRIVALVLCVALTSCASSEGTSTATEQSRADFSSIYKTWTLPHNWPIEWAAGASATQSTMAHWTDDTDGVNKCDCDTYGYGSSDSGQIRVVACVYRGNPALSASKCTAAMLYSDFNFTKIGAILRMCFKGAGGNYDNCGDAI